MRPILAAAAALALAGCSGARSGLASTYGPLHLFGGYTDNEMEEDGLWRITGAGNGPAGPGFGRNVALYRAAEVMKAHGFSHFQILDQKGQMHRVGVGGASMSYAGENLTLIVRGTSDPAAPVACRAKQPEKCMTLSVDWVMATIGPQLVFRKDRSE